MNIHRTFAPICLVVALSACTTIGKKFDIAKVDQLEPGVSTIADAVKLLGPSTAESSLANNSKLLQWQYSQGSIVASSGAHVAILFDQAGRMVRITHKFNLNN